MVKSIDATRQHYVTRFVGASEVRHLDVLLEFVVSARPESRSPIAYAKLTLIRVLCPSFTFDVQSVSYKKSRNPPVNRQSAS